VLTFGLYSALRAWSAIVLRSRRQSRLTVATMFLKGMESNQPTAQCQQLTYSPTKVYQLVVKCHPFPLLASL